jgi:hypothetical protein
MNSNIVKNGDIVEYQGRCWVVTGKDRSLFGGPPVYHLIPPGEPNRIHAVPRVAFSRVGPWR